VRSINKPTKSAGNPVFEQPPNVATWDYGKVYVDVLRFGDGDYRMWYSAAEDSVLFKRRLAYATSADGLTWARPVVGLVTFGGNTNNNILIDTTCGNVAIDYDGTRSPAYVLVMENVPGEEAGIYVLGSSDGINWALLKTVAVSSTFGWSLHIEGKEIYQRDDGRWIVYATIDHDIQRRKICAFLSDTSDIAGDWTYLGVVIGCDSQDDQKYALGVEFIENQYYGFCMNFNKTTEQVHIDLYSSGDALNWTLISDEWIPRGDAGAFDDEMIFAGKSLVRVGDAWNFYYSGFLDNHAGAQPRDAQIGCASVGYRRIGQVAGTGTLTSTPITPLAGQSLTINAYASGGAILVELLDALDNVLPGFSFGDCTPVTTSAVSAVVVWSGGSLPSDEIKIKFYLTDAILYSYEIT
jgi:hypothetical protein